MTTKFEPLFNRLLVKRAEETKEKGGIYFPEISREKPQEGTVIAAGEGSYQDGAFIATTVKAGDRILFSKFAGTDIIIDGEEFMIIQEQEVLGRIVREEAKPYATYGEILSGDFPKMKPVAFSKGVGAISIPEQDLS